MESRRQTASSSPMESRRQTAQGTRGDMTDILEVYEANEGEMDCEGENSKAGDNSKSSTAGTNCNTNMTSPRATSAPLLSFDGEHQERGEEGRRAASGLSAGDASLVE